MTETYTAEWYDTAMTEREAPSMLPLEDSPWLPMYEHLASLIQPHEEVVDLGCGTGRFLELLSRRSHYARLIGYDWSQEAIEEGKRYAHKAMFLQESMEDWRPASDRPGNTVYVCSEVLEHLEDDLALVRKIPSGHRFIFTVPNFDSASHVRVFRNVGDLWGRYEGLLKFRSWKLIELGPLKVIHACETIRRRDSW